MSRLDRAVHKYLEDEKRTDYTSLEKCGKGWLYKLHSRNLAIGVFNGVEGNHAGFIGIRTKFGSRFLATEYHWDTHSKDWPFATAKPLVCLDKLPDDIELVEHGPTVDKESGRLVAFDKPIAEGGSGWYFLDTGEPSTEIEPVCKMNQALFDWLEKMEARYVG